MSTYEISDLDGDDVVFEKQLLDASANFENGQIKKGRLMDEVLESYKRQLNYERARRRYEAKMERDYSMLLLAKEMNYSEFIAELE